VPGSAAFTIDIAGAKLRSALASAGSMLFFALWRGAPPTMLNRPADLMSKKGPAGSLVVESSILPPAFASYTRMLPPRCSIAPRSSAPDEVLATHKGYLSRISTFTVPSPVAVLKGLVLVAFIGRIREQGESLETAVYRGTLLRPRPRALLTFAVQSP